MAGYISNKSVDIDFKVCNYLHSDRNMLGTIATSCVRLLFEKAGTTFSGFVYLVPR